MRSFVQDISINVVHKSLLQLVVQVFPVDLLEGDGLLLFLYPVEDQLFVTSLAKTEAVPVSLFTW